MVDCFNAPIARHDVDDFGDFQSTENYNNKIKEDLLNDNNFFPDFNPLNEGSMHASLENLVNSFDETISKCFSISEEKLDSVSPMYGSTPENSVFDKSRLWYKITGNLGNIVPLEWSKSRIFQLQTASLHLIDREDSENQNLDLPDDDELIAAFDHHSLITPRLPDGMEPLKSVDEIINEIDQIMGEDDDLDTPTDAYGFIVPDCDSFIMRRELIERPPNWDEELQKLSIRQLNEYLEELESSIRDFSANLVEQLAIREELDFEKEQKDRFVSLVHGIHKRLEAKGLPSTTNLGAHRRTGRASKANSSSSKKKPPKNGVQQQAVGGKCLDPASDKELQILTTTLPYHQCNCPPSTDLLQTFNEILSAMTSNSPSVSGQLTDYILNVYAPAEKLAPPALP